MTQKFTSLFEFTQYFLV